MCSVVKRCGYMEAFQWGAQYVQGKLERTLFVRMA